MPLCYPNCRVIRSLTVSSTETTIRRITTTMDPNSAFSYRRFIRGRRWRMSAGIYRRTNRHLGYYRQYIAKKSTAKLGNSANYRPKSAVYRLCKRQLHLRRDRPFRRTAFLYRPHHRGLLEVKSSAFFYFSSPFQLNSI